MSEVQRQDAMPAFWRILQEEIEKQERILAQVREGCPVCGGTLQATLIEKTWLTFEIEEDPEDLNNDVVVAQHYGDDESELLIYCANDRQLAYPSSHEIYQALWDAATAAQQRSPQ